MDEEIGVKSGRSVVLIQHNSDLVSVNSFFLITSHNQVCLYKMNKSLAGFKKKKKELWHLVNFEGYQQGFTLVAGFRGPDQNWKVFSFRPLAI